MARTIIEELVTLFRFQMDKDSAKDALKTYSDLHHAARDLVSIAGRTAEVLIEPLRAVIALGEHAVNTGRRIGATAEEVQSLDIAARVTGVSATALTTTIDHLGRSSAEAAYRHREQIQAFAHLGVSFRDVNGHVKSGTKLFYEVSEALSKVSNTGLRSQYAFHTMGEASGQLMPLLALGPGYLHAIREEAEKSGAILSNETAQAAKDVAFWMEMLGLNVDGVRNRVSSLLPLVSKLLGTLYQWIDRNRDIINQHLDTVLSHVAKGVEVLARVFFGLWHAAESVVKYLGGFENVLIAIEALLGATLIAAFSAATFAVLKFGASLLLANAFPALMAITFGVLIGLLFIVIQDLTSADSLLKQLWNDPAIEKDDGSAMRFLKHLVGAVKDVTEAFQIAQHFWGDFTFDIVDGVAKAFERIADALERGASYFTSWQTFLNRVNEVLPEWGGRAPDEVTDKINSLSSQAGRVWNWATSPLNFGSDDGATSSTLSPGRLQLGGGSGVGDVSVEINQTFGADTSADIVKTATTAAINEASSSGAWEKIAEAARKGTR